MAIYLYRLIPPRPTFPAGMTAEEGAAMQQHFGYWGEQMGRGTVRVVGPVADPKGTYGIAVLDVADEAAARALCAADPVLQPGLGFAFELFEMPNALVPAPVR